MQNLHHALVMLNRRKWTILLASVILMVCLVLILVRKREPQYEGKSLSEWLIDLEGHAHTDRHAPRYLEAEDAIRHMGTNALPYLLVRLRYNPDSRTRTMLIPVIDLLPQAIVPSMLADWRSNKPGAAGAQQAICAIQALGTNALPALPELTRMAQDSTAEDRANRAIWALHGIGPQAIPALYQIILNTNAPSRGAAVRTLAYFGTNSAQAVPFLIRCLNDPDEDVSWEAVTSLGRVRLGAQASVPALIRVLQNPNPRKRAAAAGSLGNLGAAATPAIPALLHALTDTDSEVQKEADHALAFISPEALANARAK